MQKQGAGIHNCHYKRITKNLSDAASRAGFACGLSQFTLYLEISPSGGPLKAAALGAVNRLAPERGERHFGVSAALYTNSRIQVPAGDTADACAADPTHLILCRAAFCTTLRLSGKSFAGKELLLIGTKSEHASAIDTF